MQLQQTSVKLLFDGGGADLDEGAFIPVFHGWIREHRLGDRLLIDVADYRHVHQGPGVMLIGDQAHYAIDGAGGRRGLRYDRKRDAPGDPTERLEEALREALAAALALEQEPVFGGRLRFRTDVLQIRVLSRLVAPGSREELEAPLRALLDRLYEGAVVEVGDIAEDGPRAPFGVEVRAGGAPPLLSLLARLG